MTLSTVPICSAPITWIESFSGAFVRFPPLVNLLARSSVMSHWAVALENGEGLYVLEGALAAPAASALDALQWVKLSDVAYLGAPLSVDTQCVEDAKPLINALLPLDDLIVSAAPSNALEEVVHIADNLPFLVSYLDNDLHYRYVNNRYEQLFNLPKSDILGRHLRHIIGDDQFQNVQPSLKKALSGESVELHISASRQNTSGSLSKHFVACNFEPRFVDNSVSGLYVCVRDQTPLKRITQALKRFHELTSQTNLTLDEKINEVLSMGCQILNLPVGIVSHVKGQRYTVSYSHSPDGQPLPGTQFELGNCYCVHTLNREQVTGFYHAGKSDIATHPCYENFRLEAYLGVSLNVSNAVWGTLNFSGLMARDEDFSDDEYELVKLFGQWVSIELTREETKRSILAAEKQHRMILESVSDGIIGVDHLCNISFVNSAAAKLLGLNIETMIGESAKRFLRMSTLHPDAPSVSIDALASSLQNGQQIAHVETQLYRANGETLLVNFSCTPVENTTTDGIHCVLTFQDITDQKRAQNALLEQMELFRSLFMDAPEAILVTDEKRRIVMVNPHTLGLFGYQEADLIGRTPEVLYSDKDEFERVGLAYDALNSPEREEYQMVYQRADGTTFVADNVRSKLIDSEGGFKGFIIHARDISARLMIEKDIARARDRLSVATAAAGIGVWEMDIVTQTIWMDCRMCELYGFEFTDEPVAYEVWESMLHPDDLEAVREASAQAIQAQHVLSVNFRITRKDGALRHIKANGRTSLGSDGQPTHLFGTNLDITKQHETESVLRNAREEAIRASQAKSNFLATMSHEIRTPLNGVLGMAEILSGSSLTQQQHNQLEIIRNSGESLLELINEILDFSKIEAGHLTLESVEFDLERLVYDLSRLLVIKAEAKSVDLLVNFNIPEMPIVRGDAYRIRQILMNLVGNAIKFTEVGQVVICVCGSPNTDRNDITVSFEVDDTGIGISQEAQGQLFQAFTQADNSTTRKFGGTGLGLAITKQLVDLMGGSIRLNSQVGKGSTFCVTLPLDISSQPLPAVTEPVQALSKILVVDDNATNLSILRNQLEQCGLKADYELDSPRALARVVDAAAQNKPYDVLIVDYLMPDMDGLTLSRNVRKQLAEKHYPKILMISSSGTLDNQNLVNTGISVCLNKPASIQDISTGLKSLSNACVNASFMQPSRYQTGSTDVNQAAMFASASILVAEDMKANQAVVKGMLSQLNVKVAIAENGLEAIEYWQQKHPDIILMDLHMPVMDGIEAIRLIRQKEIGTGQRVPILALTADIQPERVIEVEEVGGDGFISKPFRSQELISTISSWLEQQKMSTENGHETMLLAESNSNNSLDDSVLAALEEILGEQVQDIVLAFIGDANEVIVALEQALENNSIEDMFRPAHSLKSVSANVGAMGLNGLAAELESQARAGSVDEPADFVQQIKEEFAKVKAHLQKLGRLP